MKVPSAAIIAALFATSVSAAAVKPQSFRKHDNHQQQQQNAHTDPLVRLSHFQHPQANSTDPQTARATKSRTWAGAVASPPKGQIFTSVSGKLTVPRPNIPEGAKPGVYTGCSWVGIDGDAWGGAILQAGINWAVDSSSGKTERTYSLWTEWYPNPQVPVAHFPVKAGDVIAVSVTADSASSGTIVLADETTGHSVTTTAAASSPTQTLRFLNAEWIVEDYTIDGALAPFADYGRARLRDCAAGVSDGRTVSAKGAELLEMADVNTGAVISSVKRVSASEVDVSFAR